MVAAALVDLDVSFFSHAFFAGLLSKIVSIPDYAAELLFFSLFKA